MYTIVYRLLWTRMGRGQTARKYCRTRVDFRHAALIFQGPVLEAEDKREDYGEQRFRALGQVAGETYMVAYTWRDGNRRIISAWKVGNDGKKRYEAILAGRADKDA